MGKVKDALLFTLIRNFLEVYLPVHRGAGANTVNTYRAGLNQYLDFVADKQGISRYAVTASMFSYEMVTEYLQYLTAERKLSPATCNNRLAVIRAFITYASACKPEYIDLKNRLGKIKSKKNDNFGKVDYMSEAAVKALMEAPDTSTNIGLQDQLLMILLYDTGARIQEVLHLKLCDFKLDKTPTVILHGKGSYLPIFVSLSRLTTSSIHDTLSPLKSVRIGADQVIYFRAALGLGTPESGFSYVFLCTEVARA